MRFCQERGPGVTRAFTILHHQSLQRLGTDPDLIITPLIVLNETQTSFALSGGSSQCLAPDPHETQTLFLQSSSWAETIRQAWTCLILCNNIPHQVFSPPLSILRTHRLGTPRPPGRHTASMAALVSLKKACLTLAMNSITPDAGFQACAALRTHWEPTYWSCTSG
ncbi:hypothetical protein VTK26DRAFT_4943 [Humicola hyalothermophila]